MITIFANKTNALHQQYNWTSCCLL